MMFFRTLGQAEIYEIKLDYLAYSAIKTYFVVFVGIALIGLFC